MSTHTAAVVVRFPARGAVLGGGALAAFLAIGHTATDAVTSTLAALLPLLQDRFGLAESTLALLVAALAFSSSLTQPLFGALADRLGRRAVGGIGVMLSAMLMSLIGWPRASRCCSGCSCSVASAPVPSTRPERAWPAPRARRIPGWLSASSAPAGPSVSRSGR